MHLETTLKDPMYNRISEQVLGGGTVVSAEILWLFGARFVYLILNSYKQD